MRAMNYVKIKKDTPAARVLLLQHRRKLIFVSQTKSNPIARL